MFQKEGGLCEKGGKYMCEVIVYMKKYTDLLFY
jgi:hypothetical protein